MAKVASCGGFFILITNFIKNRYLSNNNKSISLVKLNHSDRKYGRKKFPEVQKACIYPSKFGKYTEYLRY